MLARPYPFASDHARFSYFTHPGRDPAYAARDDTRSRVVVLSGLPERARTTGSPAITTGARRSRPTIVSGRAATCVRESVHLERDPPLSGAPRPTLSLLADYHAHVTIVAVEAHPHDLRRHNQDRRRPVAWEAVERVLDEWEAPSITECHRLEVV